MSRPLFVGSYLQVTWWTLGQLKEEKNASNDNTLLNDKYKQTYSTKAWFSYDADLHGT